MNDIIKLLSAHLERITEEYIKARRSCDPSKAEYYRGAKNELIRIINELKEA